MPSDLPQKAKRTGCPLITAPHGLAAPQLQAAPPVPDSASCTEQKGHTGRGVAHFNPRAHASTRCRSVHTGRPPCYSGLSRRHRYVAKLSSFTHYGFRTPKVQLAFLRSRWWLPPASRTIPSPPLVLIPVLPAAHTTVGHTIARLRALLSSDLCTSSSSLFLSPELMFPRS